MSEKGITTASVKVMRSYDYCHFEVVLGIGECNQKDVDELRKTAMRLADKAVEQYRLPRYVENYKCNNEFSFELLHEEVAKIHENIPESERTPEHHAKIKHLADMQYRMNHHYDYVDDFSLNEWGDE